MTAWKSLLAAQRRSTSLCVIAGSLLIAVPVHAAEATAFVASSLVDVTTDLAVALKKETGREVAIVPGASSTLAQQILAGAPADVFVSANKFYAQQVADATGKQMYDLFGNRLVIIAPDDFEGEVDIADLPELLGDGRLAVGDPSHVPAGIYAQQAMEQAGVWNDLGDRLAPAGDVRAAVAFVRKGASPFGIVYETDAATDGVHIVGRIDAALHKPIRYWGIVLSPDSLAAEFLLTYANSFKGQNIIAYYGFDTVISRHD